jgi:hypothetical protein
VAKAIAAETTATIKSAVDDVIKITSFAAAFLQRLAAAAWLE